MENNLSHLTLHEEDLEDEEKVVGNTPGNELPSPEIDSKEVTSHAIDDESEKSKKLAEVMLHYYQNKEDEEEDEDEEEEEEDEEDKMSDTDHPDVSVLSHLDPDPSLGCLPRREPRRRSTTWSYVTPEEPPQEKAWNYLTKRNIVQLLEKITSEIFFHRFPSPLDYMIEAIDKARLQNQEEEEKEKRHTKKRFVSGDGDGGEISSGTDNPDDDDDDAKDKSGATEENEMVLFPSQEDYINDVILVPPQDDVIASGGGTTDDVTSFGGKLDPGNKKRADDGDRWSTMTIVSENVYDDDEDKVTCFPQVALDLELDDVDQNDVNRLADETDDPRVVTSKEALTLLSFLS